MDQQQQQQQQQQRFLAEPSDTWALVGQPWASLSCLVANKRAPLFWYKDTFWLAKERKVFGHKERYSVEVEPALGETVEQPASNYTLRIHNVQLADEARFLCKLPGQGEAQPTIATRAARLNVLQPPTRLEIAAKLEAPEQRDKPANAFHEAGQADEPQPVLAAASADQQQPGDPAGPISRLLVVQNRRLRLECAANQAKPRAQLVWLDAEGRPVPRLGPGDQPVAATKPSANQSDEPRPHEDFAEELIQLDTESARLELATLIWSFKVTSEHHNKVLTCRAAHPAFELLDRRRLAANSSEASASASAFSQQAREQRVVLDVQHEPIIELTYEAPERPQEFRPIRFHCRARARPNQLRYKWFIDKQLVENATRPWLYIGSLGRQLHMREIRCQVSNAIGSSLASLTQPVRYSPSLVGQLAPGHHQRPASSWAAVAGAPTTRLGALGYTRGQNVTLSCEFDSNPKPDKIRWEKINTDYNVMANVSPERADDLIAHGGAGASLMRSPQVLLGRQLIELAGGADLAEQLAGPGERGPLRRPPARHLQAKAGAADNQGRRPAGGEQLDAEQISDSLQAELAKLRDLQRRSNGTVSLVEELIGDSQAPFVTLSEPLAWRLRPRVRPAEVQPDHDESGATKPSAGPWAPTTRQILNYKLLPSSSSGDSNNQRLLAAEDENENDDDHDHDHEELVLLDPASQALPPAALKLKQRQTVIHSSSIRLTGTNVESMGRYVCTALTQANSGLRPMSKSIYLVPMERPRIIITKNQSAPVGAARVECLAQIHTVNDTQIRWFRNGQLIDVMQRVPGKPEKKSYISEQRSPDLLFMRSILLVNNSDIEDFGRYECQVNNSFFTDTTSIYLAPIQADGLTFKLLAYLTIASLILFSAVVSLFVSLAQPFRKFGSLTKTITVINPAPAKDRPPNGPHSDQSAPGRRGPNDGLAAPGAHENQMEAGEQLDGCKPTQHGLLPPPHSQQAAYRYNESAPFGASLRPTSAASTTMMMTINNQNHYNQLVGSAAPARPESALSYEPAMGRHSDAAVSTELGLRQHQSFRSSLRQPVSYSSSGAKLAANGFAQPMASKRFAAIHESLEHKLQFGQSGQHQMASTNQQAEQSASGASKTVPPNGRCDKLETRDDCGQQAPGISEENYEPKPDQLAERRRKTKWKRSDTNESISDQRATSSSRATRARLIDRIWCKLRQGAAANGRLQAKCSIGTAGKRPTISLPVELMTNGSQTTGANECQSSLSNSRTTINSASDATSLGLQSSDSNAATNLQLLRHQRLALHHKQQHYHNHHHQVSSSQANLIQDRAISSQQPATPTNGGAESYTSGRSSQLGANQPHQSHTDDFNNLVSQQQQAQANYLDQQQLDWLQTRQQTLDGQNLYENGGQLDGRQVLYHSTQTGVAWATPTSPMGANGANQLEVQQQQQQQQQQQATYGHYQMPSLVGESAYLSIPSLPMMHQQQQLVGLQEPRACYASICSKPTGVVANIYGTSMGPPPPPPPPPPIGQQLAYRAANTMIPTSHDNDAYFESNYGTLLASAYKSLGFAQKQGSSSNSNSTHSSTLQANDSSSSSPNSLTTHANISSQNNLSSRDQQQLLVEQANSKQIGGTYLVYNPINQHLIVSEENCAGRETNGGLESSQQQLLASMNDQKQIEPSSSTALNVNTIKSSSSSSLMMKDDGIATHV